MRATVRRMAPNDDVRAALCLLPRFRNLTSITIDVTTLQTFGTIAFGSNLSGFTIKVPAASVSSYKLATGWSIYVSLIKTNRILPLLNSSNELHKGLAPIFSLYPLDDNSVSQYLSVIFDSVIFNGDNLQLYRHESTRNYPHEYS